MRVGPLGCAGGPVVAGGVEGELAEELAGGSVDDGDVQVLDEQQDAGSGVGPADADVVQAAAGAQADGAGRAGAIGADAVVGVGVAAAGGGFRPGSSGCSPATVAVWRVWPVRWAAWSLVLHGHVIPPDPRGHHRP